MAFKRLSVHLRTKWLWALIWLLSSSISFEYLIKASESLKCFMPVLWRFFINNWYFASYGSLACKSILSISGWWFHRWINAFVFPDQEPSTINIFFYVFFCNIIKVKISLLFRLLLHLLPPFLHTRSLHMHMFLSNQLITFVIIIWI